MHKKMRLVPANDNRVPPSFETIEQEEEAFDLAIVLSGPGPLLMWLDWPGHVRALVR